MHRSRVILLAEDDENDILLLRIALDRAAVSNPLLVVRNGEEAINYLSGKAPYSDRHHYPWPALMLLDLKMPRVDGLEVLAWRNSQPMLCLLPVIVLSSSNLEVDLQRSMDLGADAYRLKSADLNYLVQFACELRDGWLSERPAVHPGLSSPALSTSCARER